MTPCTPNYNKSGSQTMTAVESGLCEDDSSSNSNRNNSSNNNATATLTNGYYLRWSRIHKWVELKENTAGLMGGSSISSAKKKNPHNHNHNNNNSSSSSNNKRAILCNCSGYAAPGEVLAIMGPSGAGKTSLMDVISGRSTYQKGVISINGEPTSGHSMKRLMSKVAYVKQKDIFFGHLTVRDQLSYTALLRMSAKLSKAEKIAEVERIIRLLRLGKVADSQIKDLSGGERKRVNIGTELLTDPTIILLDEPTSGLDSTSAVSLLQLLQVFARQHGKTVITSIHQPSSRVYRSFDRVLFMSDGLVVYFGTPVESLQYLRQQGLACPDGYNAADHWMDLLVTDSAVEEERNEQQNGDDDTTKQAGNTSSTSPRFQLQNAWDSEAVAEQMDQALVVAGSNHGGSQQQQQHASDLETGNKYNTSWMTQYLVLTHRALKNSHSAIFTPLNIMKSVAIGIVAGVLWFQMEYTELNVNDIRSYYFFTMTFWVFDSMFQALTSFPSERDVIMKERASGSYHLSAYFMAKTTSDAPVRLVLPLLYMVISYWMIGISKSFVTFLAATGCTLLSVVAGEAVGLFVGAAILDLQQAITTMTVAMLFLMLLGGFFVENIPSFISWAKYISPFKYAFDSSLRLIFDRDVPCDGSGALEELCAGDREAANVEDVLDFIGLQGSLGFNVGLLVVLCFVPRYFAYLALRLKKTSGRP